MNDNFLKEIYKKQQDTGWKPTYRENLPAEPVEKKQTIVPDAQEWDYRTSTVSPSGTALPAGAVGWTPRGDPYFGPGIKGTLAKYTWMLSTPNSSAPSQKDWGDYHTANESAFQVNSQMNQALAAGNTELAKELAGQRLALFGEATGKFFQNVLGMSDFFEKDDVVTERTTTDPQGKVTTREGVDSPLTPLLRLTKVGLVMAADLFSEAAIKIEQTMGAMESAREASGESPLPNIFRVDKIQVSEQAKRNLELFVQIAPPVVAYNALRFLAAPVDHKKVLSEGFNAGRILYSSILDPALREEFIRRARAGEDPQLLAMELENPWAELVGQVIVDPLNLIGFIAKAYKVGHIVDRAEDAVYAGSKFADEWSETTKILSGVPDDTRALESIDKLIDARRAMIQTVEEVGLTQSYKARVLSIAGNQSKYTRNMQSFFLTGVADIIRAGGTSENVADWLKYGVLSASENRQEAALGISGLMNMPSARLQFSESATETFVILRNLLKNEDGVIDAARFLQRFKKANGDLAEVSKTMGGMIEDAAKRQFPTFAQMTEAAKAVKSGKPVTARVQQLADALTDMDVGTRRMLETQDKLALIKNPTNKVLGAFYFNTPGFALRNMENNFLTTLVDEGSKAFFQDGKYWSQGAIDDYLKGWHGGQLPPEAAGFITQVEEAGSTATKFLPSSWNQKFEQAAAKRIYWSRFKETVDQMLQPGRALPRMDEFKAAGFTEDQVKHFTRLMKDNHGNVNKTINEMFTGKKDAWRMYELFTDPEDLKGLSELGLDEQIAKLVNDPNATREQVIKFFDDSVKEAKARAATAANNMTNRIPDEGADAVAQSMRQASQDGYMTGNEKFEAVVAQSFQAVDEYTDVLLKARNTTLSQMQGAPEFQTLLQEFTAWEKTAMSETARAVVRQTTKGVTENAWQVTRAANKGEDLAVLWEKADLPGTIPIGTTRENFLNKVWDHTRNKVSAEWNTYFDDVFMRSEQLAQSLGKLNPGLMETFTRARNSVLKANVYRHADDSKKGMTIADGIRIAPPYVAGTTPTPGTMWQGVMKPTVEALERMKGNMLSRWGVVHPDNFSPENAKAMAELTRQVQGRVTETQAVAAKVGRYWRDFALLPYGETLNMDVALAHVYPYRFWYMGGEAGGTYGNWLRRAASDPQVIANYFRIKDAMASAHKDSPEWFRYNVRVPDFLGINHGNPLIMNLEANIWPLNGLTGVDFNDPQKRVNWLTAMVDDSGKLGPSIWAPIQMAMAAALYMQGDKEAAARWGGRLIPQTQTFKSIAALVAGKTIELDPAVQVFSGEGLFDFSATDPYEKNRIGPVLESMVGETLEDGTVITAEAAIEAARLQEGPIWDAAYLRSTQLRAPGNLSAFALGTGFKPRTHQDELTDEFWHDYGYLRNMSADDLISPEDYRVEMDKLREKFPFMDAVLLARKASPERDAAYTYNVLGRIPPGDMTRLFKELGIKNDEVSQFYENKGDISYWPEGDQKRFMGAVITMGAMFAMPENATRQSWTQAKRAYQAMQTEIEKAIGNEVSKQVETYYGLFDVDPDQAYDFKDSHPDVQTYLDMKNQYVISDPNIFRYYGSLDTIQSYWTGVSRANLQNKYGDNIYELYYQYMDMIDPAEKKAFKRANPQLGKFMDEKPDWQELSNRMVVDMANKLPDQPELPLRDDFTPRSGAQEMLMEAVNQRGVQANDLLADMSPALRQLVALYWQGDDDAITYQARQQLDYLGEPYGLSADEVLQVVGVGP